MQSLFRKRAILGLWPLAALLALSALLRWSEFDLRISALFFDAGVKNWPYFDRQPWSWLFQYGTLPAIGIGVLALIHLLVTWLRRTGTGLGSLVVVLTLVLGPGLIINGVLKPSWGRPRPMECVQFGGDKEFMPVGSRNFQSTDRSFPSGHASTGFFLMVPGLLLIHRHRRWAMAIIVVGLAYGLAMGLGRVIQGRHFPSDILWSLGITYYTALVLAYLAALVRQSRLPPMLSRSLAPWRNGCEQAEDHSPGPYDRPRLKAPPSPATVPD